MSTEINTRGMVRSKVTSFPTGNDTECLSKSEITSTGKALVNGSYGDNECPVIDDVSAYIVTYEDCFTVNGQPYRVYLSVNRSVHDIDLEVCAAKKKYINGVYAGIVEYYNWEVAYTGSPPKWMVATKISNTQCHLRIEYNSSGYNREYGVYFRFENRKDGITLYVLQSINL